MRALLVYPQFPVTYWGFQHGLEVIGKRASLPPLGLVTVAASLPRDWELRLVDLNVRELLDAELAWAEVVLTGGMLVQADSIRELVRRAHVAGRRIVVGGPAPTTTPELFDEADIVFRGELEGRTADLVSAIKEGQTVRLDAPPGYPDISETPVPRFDLLDLASYASMSIQYSRGCPFRCEFCDIVAIFGRRPRVKSSAQILAELDALDRLGYRGTLFFVDDNFIGNRPAVRTLLPELLQWQETHGRPFELYTEASLDLAGDPALTQEMVAAGFTAVFVGIETPSREALSAVHKTQNLRVDVPDAVERLTRAGLEVMGGFIVGFDSDGPAIFEAQRQLIQALPIPLAMVGLLIALPGTALQRRLEAEGRLRERTDGDHFGRPNFAPVMDEEALLSGYRGLLADLYSPEAYYRRCEAYVDRVGPTPSGGGVSARDVQHLLRSLIGIGVRSPRRLLYWRLLLRTLLRAPRQLKWAVTHAVMGEHVVRYTEEHVLPRLERALAEVRADRHAAPRPVRRSQRVAA